MNHFSAVQALEGGRGDECASGARKPAGLYASDAELTAEIQGLWPIVGGIPGI